MANRSVPSLISANVLASSLGSPNVLKSTPLAIMSAARCFNELEDKLAVVAVEAVDLVSIFPMPPLLVEESAFGAEEEEEDARLDRMFKGMENIIIIWCS